MANYQIKSGDTLTKIAQQYNTTVQALASANNIADPNKIQAGSTLTIPGSTPAPTPASSSGKLNFSITPKPTTPTPTPTPYNIAQPSVPFQPSIPKKTASPIAIQNPDDAFLHGTTSPVPTSTPASMTAPASKSGGSYFKVGNDVYESGSNRHIDLAEFKSLGLNIDHIPVGSLSGGVTGKNVTSTVNSQATGNQISNSFGAQTGAQGSNTLQSGAQNGSQGASINQNAQLDQSQFANVIDSMRTKLAYNNDLINARQLLVTQLYDRPLTEAEIAKLPANFQDVARSNDNRQVEMRIRLLNDEIQGRTNTMDQSISYLTSAYKDDLNRAEEQKQQATNTILGFVDKFGSEAGDAMRSMYTEDQIRKLEEVTEMNIDNLSNLPKSLDQIKDSATGSDNGFTPYQTFQATQALKKNTQTMNAASMELKRQSGILTDTWNRFESGGAKDLNGTSQAIVTTFNKLLDPTSVVREAEYDRTASGQALINTISGKLAAVVQGGPGLTPESLKELVDLGNLYARNAQTTIDERNAAAREEAAFFGLNPDFVTSGGNNTGANTTSGGPTDIKSIAEAIAKVESGGNYKAIGPMVTSGMYKGDKAYGKYQIMGLNIPEWTKQATGTSYTKEQFLADPDLQDYTALYKMQQYYDKYGNAEDVFSSWFTGGPVSTSAGKKDVTGTSSEKYVSMASGALKS